MEHVYESACDLIKSYLNSNDVCIKVKNKNKFEVMINRQVARFQKESFTASLRLSEVDIRVAPMETDKIETRVYKVPYIVFKLAVTGDASMFRGCAFFGNPEIGRDYEKIYKIIEKRKVLMRNKGFVIADSVHMFSSEIVKLLNL